MHAVMYGAHAVTFMVMSAHCASRTCCDMHAVTCHRYVDLVEELVSRGSLARFGLVPLMVAGSATDDYAEVSWVDVYCLRRLRRVSLVCAG